MGAYCIKGDYEHRTFNATYENRKGQYWHYRRVIWSRHAQFAVYQKAALIVRERILRTVLDVGCGSGYKAMELIAPLANVTGVDQPNAVALATKAHPDGHFVAADFDAPGDDGLETFDLVLCVDVIEHMASPDKLIQYIKDKCHAASIVVISTPERDILRGPDNTRSPQPEHVREWNRAEFREYLESLGFMVTEHEIMPSFSIRQSPYMLLQWLWSLLCGVNVFHTQVAICRLNTE